MNKKETIELTEADLILLYYKTCEELRSLKIIPGFWTVIGWRISDLFAGLSWEASRSYRAKCHQRDLDRWNELCALQSDVIKRIESFGHLKHL